MQKKMQKKLQKKLVLKSHKDSVFSISYKDQKEVGIPPGHTFSIEEDLLGNPFLVIAEVLREKMGAKIIEQTDSGISLSLKGWTTEELVTEILRWVCNNPVKFTW